MTDPIAPQYEDFPYPLRDPKDEVKRLVTGSPSNWDEVKHYLFQGHWDPTRPFRALIAGGGTGDATIMLAQQLQDAGQEAELVYLDQSKAARTIAEQRAKVRGLDNITFLSATIEELPQRDLAPFDYIDCCGVLMHLADPAAGLAALRAVLKPGGGLGVMVYGTYGRTGVYHLQSALRRLLPDAPLGDAIATAKILLAELPESNWFKRNPFIGDHRTSDAGLVDLLLHARDRPYRVEELVALVKGAGLGVTSFIEPARYEPETYLKDEGLIARALALPEVARWALAEELVGNMKTHVLYLTDATRASKAVAEVSAASVPVYRDLDGKALAASLAKTNQLKVSFERLPLVFTLPAGLAPLAAAIDGKRTLAAITQTLVTQGAFTSPEQVEAGFDTFYKILNGINRLLLRSPVPS